MRKRKLPIEDRDISDLRNSAKKVFVELFFSLLSIFGAALSALIPNYPFKLAKERKPSFVRKFKVAAAGSLFLLGWGILDFTMSNQGFSYVSMYVVGNGERTSPNGFDDTFGFILAIVFFLGIVITGIMAAATNFGNQLKLAESPISEAAERAFPAGKNWFQKAFYTMVVISISVNLLGMYMNSVGIRKPTNITQENLYYDDRIEEATATAERLAMSVTGRAGEVYKESNPEAFAADLELYDNARARIKSLQSSKNQLEASKEETDAYNAEVSWVGLVVAFASILAIPGGYWGGTMLAGIGLACASVLIEAYPSPKATDAYRKEDDTDLDEFLKKLKKLTTTSSRRKKDEVETFMRGNFYKYDTDEKAYILGRAEALGWDTENWSQSAPSSNGRPVTA